MSREVRWYFLQYIVKKLVISKFSIKQNLRKQKNNLSTKKTRQNLSI